MDYNFNQHDIGLLRQDGSTKVGLMLLRDKNDVPAWAEFDDEILARQWFTGAPDYSYRPPLKEFVWVRDDWRAGFGLKYADSTDPKRYYTSVNCDARFRGQMRAGPRANTITKPSTPSNPAITDGGLEIWTNNTLTNWTKSGDAAFSKDDANEQEGDYCAKIDGVGATYFYQDVDLTNDYAGCTITFTAHCKTAQAASFRLAISDGVDTTDGTTAHTGGGTYENLTVSKTLSLACDKIRLECHKYSAADRTGYFDGAMTCTVTAITVGTSKVFCDFTDGTDDQLYASAGRILAKLNTTTGSAFDFVAYMPATITDMKWVTTTGGTDYLFIGLGDSEKIVYMTTGEVFAQHSAEYGYFLTTTPSHLYAIKQAGGNKLRNVSLADPTAAFGDVTYVGPSSYDHTDLLTSRANTVVQGKEDMPYYIDSSDDDYPLLDAAFSSLKSSTSCKNSFAWAGNIYIQGGDQTLKEFSGTAGSATAVETDISPAKYMTDLDDFNGSIQAITGDDTYLHIVMDDGLDVQLLAGRWEYIDGSTDWRWHPLATLTLAGCETAHISNVFKKRIYISSTTAANSLYYYSVTTKYGDIANDSNYTYQTDGSFIESWQHGNLKGDPKACYELTAYLGHANDTDIYFEVHYKKWGDASWIDIGDLKGTATSRKHTLYIPDSAGTSPPDLPTNAAPVSEFFDIKFVPKLDSPYTTSPILESYNIRGAWRPTKRWIIACTVKAVDRLLLTGGQPDKGTETNIKTVLEEAAAASYCVTFYNIDGATIKVNFLPPPTAWGRVIRTWKEGNIKHIERIYDLLLQKVTVS